MIKISDLRSSNDLNIITKRELDQINGGGYKAVTNLDNPLGLRRLVGKELIEEWR